MESVRPSCTSDPGLVICRPLLRVGGSDKCARCSVRWSHACCADSLSRVGQERATSWDVRTFKYTRKAHASGANWSQKGPWGGATPNISSWPSVQGTHTLHGMRLPGKHTSLQHARLLSTLHEASPLLSARASCLESLFTSARKHSTRDYFRGFVFAQNPREMSRLVHSGYVMR